jgi:hypothetical protein
VCRRAGRGPADDVASGARRKKTRVRRKRRNVGWHYDNKIKDLKFRFVRKGEIYRAKSKEGDIVLP